MNDNARQIMIYHSLQKEQKMMPQVIKVVF